MVYFRLIFEFFKIGLFSIGGGLATLPFLYHLADKYDWFTREMLIDMIAISESTPGPIGINMATYAGYSAGGALGGVTATLALIIPSCFLISFIVRMLNKFKENPMVKSAFYGIRPAVAALIASAAIGIIKITLLDIPRHAEIKAIPSLFRYKELLLFFIIFYLLKKYNKHPVFYIGGAALMGALLNF